MRKARGRADAATFHHVAVADRYAGFAVDAFRELLSQLGRAFDGRRAASLVGVASPAYTAGLVAPEVVAKAVTESGLTDLFADIATEAATTRVGFNASFSLVRDESVAFARQQSATLVQGIDQQTKGLIAGIIARGQQGDLTWNQMAAEIKPLIGLSQADAQAALNYRAALQRKLDTAKYGKDAAGTVANQFALSPWKGGKLDGKVDDLYKGYVDRLLKARAVTIARTETIRAASAGEMISWQSTIDSGGADGYTVIREWSVTRDDRACKTCLALDGEERRSTVSATGRPSLAGDGGFGGVPHPPLHPRCRCVIMTTMELAPIEPGRPVEKPARQPKSWADKVAADQRAVARAAAAARGDAGRHIGAIGGRPALAPGAQSEKLEAAVRKLGRGVDREVDARLAADGLSFDEKAYVKLKADYKKADDVKAKRWHQIMGEERAKGGSGLADRVRSRVAQDARYQKAKLKADDLGNQIDRLRPLGREFAKARALHAQAVLGEIRPMGGTFGMGRIYPGQTALSKGVDVDAGLKAIAGRYPSTWIANSNQSGPLNIIYEKNRAYYSHGKGSVALSPGQFQNLAADSTATHEFMHRMEFTNPDVMRAEWAFVSRRSGPDGVAAGKVPKRLSDLTGNSAYGPAEISYEDEFSNPYMGKVYALNPTNPYEAMSMGVEGVFHGAFDMDADYRAFVLGTLAGL